MTFLGICILALLTGFPDLARLMRRGNRRQAAVSAVLLLTGLVAAQAWAAHLPVPTIGKILTWLAGPLASE